MINIRMFKIFYGVDETKIDVTDICYTQLLKDNYITIPENDSMRAKLFTDPVFGIPKFIFVVDNDQNTYIYDSNVNVVMNTVSNKITTRNDNDFYKFRGDLNLGLKHGKFIGEEQEQIMSYIFLNGNEKVLEIGGNIGRNSLIIASILKLHNDTNPLPFVAIECDQVIAQQLIENKDVNNLNFFVEDSALSERRLVQKDWDTFPLESDTIEEGFTEVKTIKLDELNKKYNIKFDTLVLDCEGAFYYIVKDMPQILDNINLVIMENDYRNREHKNYVDSMLTQRGLRCIYSKSGGWGCCYQNFFEVWKKL